MVEVTILAALFWLILLLLPWRPWSSKETLFLATENSTEIANVSALIPARDESHYIASTLNALSKQGNLQKIIVVDDQSSDGTDDIVKSLNLDNVLLINGVNPPKGWTGKLWALEQGLAQISSKFLLLLDADIRLNEGALNALLMLQKERDYDLVSVMATLHVKSLWEKLLLPPFIYFFKLIYPFALANKQGSSIAAAAGGCILIKTEKLKKIGGFDSLKGAVIDDCALAKQVKKQGGKTWLGLSHLMNSIRPNASLSTIWNMVARTAYTQLHYSLILLILCSTLMVLCFVVPLVQIFNGDDYLKIVSLSAYAFMAITYQPLVKFYNLSAFWVLTLPFASCLFLAMTWTSAIRYWRGERTRWKNRSYGNHEI